MEENDGFGLWSWGLAVVIDVPGTYALIHLATNLAAAIPVVARRSVHGAVITIR